MQVFDSDNFRYEDRGRLWLRLLVPVLLIVGCLFGQTWAIPEENIFTAHDGIHHFPIVPGILAGYLAIAVWPQNPRWSPEFVTVVAVLSAAGLYAIGLFTYKYEGHVHQIDGPFGFLLLCAAVLMATYVAPPESIRTIPRKIVVPVLTVLLLLWAAVEHREAAEEAERHHKLRTRAESMITF